MCDCSWRESQISSQRQMPSRGSLPCIYCTLCPDLPGRRRPFPSHVQMLTCRSEVQREEGNLRFWAAEQRGEPGGSHTATIETRKEHRLWLLYARHSNPWIQDTILSQNIKRTLSHHWSSSLLSQHDTVTFNLELRPWMSQRLESTCGITDFTNTGILVSSLLWAAFPTLNHTDI